MSDKGKELVYDRECASCKKMFECKGKRKNISCVNYEERKRNGK